MSEDKPCLVERYSIAIQSNHLELSPIRRGAADFLIAVGMCRGMDGEKEPLGSMLMRLKCEFDNAHGEYLIARKNQMKSMGEAKQEKDDEIRADMESQSDKDATLAHAHILLKIPSLARTREAFGNWTLIQAGKQRFMDCGMMPTEGAANVGIAITGKFRAWRKSVADRQTVVSILAGRVLDVFLEPTCLRCSGRGFSGGYNGKMQTICNNRGGCGGSGKRPIDNIGNTKEQHAFSYYLYGQAERLLTNVEIQLAERLRDDAPRAVP